MVHPPFEPNIAVWAININIEYDVKYDLISSDTARFAVFFLCVDTLWIYRSIHTLRIGLRYIRTSISAKKQQFSVALPTP